MASLVLRPRAMVNTLRTRAFRTPGSDAVPSPTLLERQGLLHRRAKTSSDSIHLNLGNNIVTRNTSQRLTVGSDLERSRSNRGQRAHSDRKFADDERDHLGKSGGVVAGYQGSALFE